MKGILYTAFTALMFGIGYQIGCQEGKTFKDKAMAVGFKAYAKVKGMKPSKKEEDPAKK